MRHPRTPLPPEASSALRDLQARHAIGPLDATFGRWLGERDAERAGTLASAGALVSAAREAGHSGLPLTSLGENGTLAASPLVGAPGERLPLIVDGDRLYLYRFWRAEEDIARRIASRLPRGNERDVPQEALRTFERLFPQEANEAPDWQAVAAAAAMRGRILLIAGGPGTGKTTTVVRILALLLSRQPDLRVSLAAPTGKAANRLAESIRTQREDERIPEEVRAHLPTEAATLHRLLGYNPQRSRFRRDADNPIPADVVLIDEASMIDMLLFDALLCAVPPESRLILLGDPHQLASVEAGFVFGDLCRAGAGERYGAAFTEHATALGIRNLPEPDPAAPPIRDAVVTLARSYRFGEASGIGRLAAAIREGDADAAIAILDEGAYPDVERLPLSGLDSVVVDRVSSYARRLLASESPADALRHLEDVRLVSAIRWGPRGVQGLNARVEDWLVREGLVVPGRGAAGRPIMITANDYDAGLFNGDLGILWQDDEHDAAYFPTDDSEPRFIGTYRLPPHETAWATTVHKSQGSEFDEVVLVLPNTAHELLTRELLYTAVTRARRRVMILGDVQTLREVIASPEQRFTGLEERLASKLPG